LGKYILEVCVDSVESAILAEQGGANRLELCSNLIIGGTTPSISLFKEVRKYTNLPIRVLIRPRFGDFLYTTYEFDVIKNDVNIFNELNADGIVVGCLEEDGTINRNQMEELRDASNDIPITFHRAFDMTKDPFESLKTLIKLGVDTVLTSGQKDNCKSGFDIIQQLINLSNNRINILIGAGVSKDIIEYFLLNSEITQFHMSGKEITESKMIYKNNTIHMGLPFLPEYEIYRTNKHVILDSKTMINRYIKE
jgi:copper homeostasis protein